MSAGEKFYLAVVLVTFLGFMGMLAVASANYTKMRDGGSR